MLESHRPLWHPTFPRMRCGVVGREVARATPPPRPNPTQPNLTQKKEPRNLHVNCPKIQPLMDQTSAEHVFPLEHGQPRIMSAFSKPRTGQYQEHHESTPPDDSPHLPLTPPTTEERLARKPDTSDVGKVMQMFEACRSHTLLEHCAPFTVFRVPPREYDELVKELGDSEALGQYINDKVR